jgi:2',3'-cyclic-nucleotide 2'-phosphodiesterase
MDSPQDAFRVLFVGDVVGRPGREALSAVLPLVQEEVGPHLTVVNGENSAGGMGITAGTAEEIFAAGADVITTGNHVWSQKPFAADIERIGRILRPHNYPPGVPGTGALLVEADGCPVLVMNLQGRVFLDAIDDPFRAADQILDELGAEAKVVVCDMHAEATSEKIAMGWHLAGRASAVFGTHTHVPTADARILPGGTAYLTDVGMVGPRDGVIGMDREIVIRRFLTAMPYRFEPANGIVTFNSAVVTISRFNGQASAIQRIDREHL